MDVSKSIELFNRTLREYSFGNQPGELYQPMKYMLGLNQHRIGPLLTFWGCYLFSGETTKALMPALGVEVFHNFIMIHEDVLDQRATRNESDCVHMKWNDNVAILSGDAMIFKAYELLIQVEPWLVKPIVRLFNQCLTRIYEGKQLMLNQPGTVNNPDILKLNPGAITAFSLQLGALIGGASMESTETVQRLGNQLGIHWSSKSAKTNESIPQTLDGIRCDKDRKRRFELWVRSYGL